MASSNYPVHSPKYFTEDEVRILQRVIDRERRQTINVPTRQSADRWDAGEDHQAPEVYVALPQTSAGIPASEETYATGDEPGAADCDIYQVLLESGVPRLRPVTGLSKKVHNVGAAIEQVWIPVARDKFGSWLAMVGSGSAGLPVEIVLFRIQSADCVTLCAIGTVLARTCGDATAVGDDIQIYDALGCMLVGNEESLVGRKGFAILMDGEDPCPGTGTWVGTGTAGATPAGCVWNILTLCDLDFGC